MGSKDLVTVAISLVALLISIYGIWDRHHETARAIRRQVLDLIDDIVQLQVQEHEPREDHGALEGWSRSMNLRRQSLIAMVEELLRSVRDGISSNEYSTLAMASQKIGDMKRANRFWEEAVRAAPPKSVTLGFARRGQAKFMFYFLNNPESGRIHFQEAIDALWDGTDIAYENIADTYVMWVRAEDSCNAETGELTKISAKIRENIDAIKNPGLRADVLRQVNHQLKSWPADVWVGNHGAVSEPDESSG